jgi:hypothetical protein
MEPSPSAEITPNRPENPCILFNPTVHWNVKEIPPLFSYPFSARNVKEIPPLDRIRIRSVHVMNSYFLKARFNLCLYEDCFTFTFTFTITLLI